MTLQSFYRNQKYNLVLHKRTVDAAYDLLFDGRDGNEPGGIVKTIQLEQQLDTPLVEAVITTRNSPSITGIIEVGDVILYYASELNLDESITYKRKHVLHVLKIVDDDNSFEKTIICKNFGHWLVRNSYHLKINEHETTSQFITRTATVYDVPIDYIHPTFYEHQARVFNKGSLLDAWRSALATNIIEEELLYNMSISDIGLRLDLITRQDKLWIFESSGSYSNILESRRTFSIIDPDFTNVAVAINTPQEGGQLFDSVIENTIIDEKRNQQSIDRYGEFRTEIDTSTYGKPSEIGERLQEIVNNGKPIDTVDFKTYAINSLKPSNKIIINYPRIEASGVYFIDSIKTTIADREYWHMIRAIKRADIQTDLISQLSAGSSERLSQLDL